MGKFVAKAKNDKNLIQIEYDSDSGKSYFVSFTVDEANHLKDVLEKVLNKKD